MSFYSKNFFEPHFIRHLMYFGVIEPSKNKSRGMCLKMLTCYGGLFTNGFTHTEFEEIIGEPMSKYDFLIRDCINDEKKFQLDCLLVDDVNIYAKNNNFEHKREKFHELFKFNRMNEKQIQEKLIILNANFSTIISCWSQYPFEYSYSNNKITLIGKIIACINANNKLDKHNKTYFSIENLIYSKYEL